MTMPRSRRWHARMLVRRLRAYITGRTRRGRPLTTAQRVWLRDAIKHAAVRTITGGRR